MKTILIIVPCYNEEHCVHDFVLEIEKIQLAIPDYLIEILFVDDGSTDNTLHLIKKCNSILRINFISFSRNFGKESAMLAGLTLSNSDYTAIMDIDLQDPPYMLLHMVDSISSGEYDCVATRRVTRKGEPPIRSFFAKMFYLLINKLSSVQIVDGARDFRLMSRQVAAAIVSTNEYNRFSKGLFQWVGFKTKWLEYENVVRRKGETKWSFWKLFLYSLDGIVAFSTAPLAIASVLGILVSFFAFLFMIYLIFVKIFIGIPLSGYASTLVIMLMLGGIQLLSIGVLGQYLSKTYIEVKGRPRFIIKERSIE